MFYFLPSWHSNNEHEWDNAALPWYRNDQKIEFDDTINQLRMFNRTHENSEILVLEYSPNLRSFLHRQDIYETDYYSVFDDIQNISSKHMRPFDFMSLDWPLGTDFSYTPFLVLARNRGKVIARIEFDNIGALLRIDFLENNKVTQRFVFDDRGFLSSVIHFNKQEHEISQVFLDLAGCWRIRVNYLTATQQVEVNPKCQEQFKRISYENIEDLIVEKFHDFLAQKMCQDDALVIAAEKKRDELILRIDHNIKMMLSFFSNRYPLDETESLCCILTNADFCVTDTDYTNMKIKKIISKDQTTKKVEQITPFDSRLRLGKSQRIKELKIFWLIEGLNEAVIQTVLQQLLSLMETDERIELTIAAYSEYKLNTETVAQVVNETIEKNDLAAHFTFNKSDQTKTVSELSESAEHKRSICWHTIHTEDDIIKMLTDVRLIVDLCPQPDLFLQIAGISAGVPQINTVRTSYVEDHKNGLIVDQLNDLSEAVKYYLVGLAHWNEALMYAANKISEYSGSKLISKWRQIIEGEDEDGAKKN
ncbi:accessory secretory protein asp1 [Liquorilactobacillus aquaticus DSM 21051]|uniref:Accessory secretory protein asp1 n=1 Tax=Liquorilactobacillus aquaticus DSM 21051 TaxID=1423725 RepID=A0A0R2CTH0_9LACO|nr:accessory Sec system protein Asp1 [Liquorilactobacillus aquaticus]KRM95057.1 accessory secretory protein asp1 [Liquorilactobacillus aquaticus DSM 21051]